MYIFQHITTPPPFRGDISGCKGTTIFLLHLIYFEKNFLHPVNLRINNYFTFSFAYTKYFY